MSTPVQEVRALLTSFTQSPWRDVHFRSGDWSLFMAKANGGPNPMLARAALAVAPVSTILRDVTAPHLGIFTARVAPGAYVQAGAVIGQLEKLDETTNVISDAAGRIATILPLDGDLVEYGAPLVQIESA
mgnify:CR=1 FL=1